MTEEFNLEERILCPDDTCIGLVGADGKCKVCGRAYEGDEPLPGESAEGDDAVSVAVQDGETEGDDLPDADADEAPPDLDERVLCSDDTCVGIIGENGVCGTCGKPAEG